MTASRTAKAKATKRGRPSPEDDLAVETGRQLVLMSQVVVRLEERVLRDLSLSYRQMRILRHVSNGITSATELGRRFGVTAPAVSETLESLVKKGFVLRGQHDTDRRAVKLILTEAGSELLSKALDAEDRLARELVSELSAERLAAFADIVADVYPSNQARLLSERQGQD